METLTRQVLNMALCEARHDMPSDRIADGHIFTNTLTTTQLTNPQELEALAHASLTKLVDDNADEVQLNLTVTGLSVALVAVINTCIQMDINLTLYHYNRDNNTYYTQDVITNFY